MGRIDIVENRFIGMKSRGLLRCEIRITEKLSIFLRLKFRYVVFKYDSEWHSFLWFPCKGNKLLLHQALFYP